MELLFFSGRHRYPGETVSWGEYFGEWLEHPVLAGAMLLCVIWMFIRIRTYLDEKKNKDETWKEIPQEELYPDHMDETEREDWEVGGEWKERLKKLAPHLWKYLLFIGYIALDFREYPSAIPYVVGLILAMLVLGDLVNLFLDRYNGKK